MKALMIAVAKEAYLKAVSFLGRETKKQRRKKVGTK
jgi:hypothetical protein